MVFACKGIEVAVKWFCDRGHKKIHVFVPNWRKEASKPETPITGKNICLFVEGPFDCVLSLGHLILLSLAVLRSMQKRQHFKSVLGAAHCILLKSPGQKMWVLRRPAHHGYNTDMKHHVMVYKVLWRNFKPGTPYVNNAKHFLLKIMEIFYGTWPLAKFPQFRL